MSEMKEQSTIPETWSDEKTYREMSKPHDSKQSATGAINSFYDDLRELRVKHKIRDVYVVTNICVIEDDGTETVMASTLGLGAVEAFGTMAAFAYGQEVARAEERMRKLLAGKL